MILLFKCRPLVNSNIPFNLINASFLPLSRESFLAPLSKVQEELLQYLLCGCLLQRHRLCRQNAIVLS